MDKKISERAAKAAGMISLLYLVSRILGFVRESLSGQLFNRFQTDAYIAAFTIPDAMYYLLVGGALSAAFIPIFTEYLAKGEEDEGWKVASTFMNIVVLLLACFTLLGVIFAKGVAPLEAPNFAIVPAKMQLLVELTRIMFPAVCFTAMAGMVGGALNSYQHFLAPALGPVFYNIAIITTAVLLGPQLGIKGMAIGVVIGAFGNFLIQIFFLSRSGGNRYRFGYIDLKNPGFHRMILLMIPALIGLSATQVNIWVTNIMASYLPEGSITAIRFANRLIQLPIGIFASGIATAFFPMLSGMAAKGQMDSFKDSLSLSLRSIFFLMLPSAVGLIILRKPIVALLFQGHQFTVHDTELTSYALLFYSLAIFAHAAILMLPRAFYALKDTRTPVIVSVCSVSLSILMNYIFLRFTKLGVGGFALSFSMMGLVNMVALITILRRKIGGIRGGRILRSFLKCLGASFAMGVALWFVNPVLLSASQHLHLTGRMANGFIVAGAIAVGVVAFFGSALLLKMEELQMALGMIKRRLHRNTAG